MDIIVPLLTALLDKAITILFAIIGSYVYKKIEPMLDKSVSDIIK